MIWLLAHACGELTPFLKALRKGKMKRAHNRTHVKHASPYLPPVVKDEAPGFPVSLYYVADDYMPESFRDSTPIVEETLSIHR